MAAIGCLQAGVALSWAALPAALVPTSVGLRITFPSSGQSTGYAGRLRLMSNYKGFPICQAKQPLTARKAGHFFICIPFKTFSFRDGVRRQGQQSADWPNYKRSLLRRLTAADPDERRTRGTHSLAGKSCAALELIGHAPRRSKPVVINACRHTAEVQCSLWWSVN